MAGVSIIIPTYNDSIYLPKALGSCLMQGGIEKEVIIVDDASTVPLVDEVKKAIQLPDGTPDPLFKYIRHETNQGLSAARNTGIKAAKYPLIIPLDADDFFFPNVLAQMAMYFGDRTTDIVYGDLWDGNGRCHPTKHRFTAQLFRNTNPLFCTSMFRKTVWERAGGYTVRPHPHYEDWNFWAKAFKVGCRFRYVPILVYTYTSRPDSMLRKLNAEDSGKYARMATEGVFR